MIQIKIEKLAYGGNGIGRIDGKICFVENALPGETVEIEIVNDKKNFIEARAVKIETPSPARETPPCSYYGKCGGCQYQHMSYAEELRWKEIQIREHLQKQMPLDEKVFLPIVANDSPYGYRNHITLHRAQNGWGFVDEDNESTVAIQKCLLAAQEINQWISTDQRPQTEDQGLDSRLHGNDRRKASHDRITVRLGAGDKVTTSAEDIFFNIPMGPIRLRTHSRCFFQNNLPMTVKIGEKLRAIYEATQPEHFWDLYSGVGTFTALVNPRKSQVLCVESHPQGIDALEMNLKNLGLAAEIAPEPVEDCLADILLEPRMGPVIALIDPPRQGLEPRALNALLAGPAPDTLAYLSCHMGALTRDLKALSSGGYRIESVQAFDMFPRTKHIETLVILKKSRD